MSYFFNSEDLSFYNDKINSNIPSAAKKISDSIYQQISSRAENEVVRAGNDGFPILVVLEESTEPIKPQSCTPAQGLVALFALKQITEDDVQAAIDSIADPVQKYTAQIAFKRSVSWDRNSPTMQLMAQLLGLSDQDLDSLFDYAVTVQA